MDILEVIRLVRAGESDHTITRVLGLNRRTVAKYRQWAGEQELVTGEKITGIDLTLVLAHVRFVVRLGEQLLRAVAGVYGVRGTARPEYSLLGRERLWLDLTLFLHGSAPTRAGDACAALCSLVQSS